MGEQTIKLNNEEDTLTLAVNLALGAKPGDLITLSGDLGAGKTLFAREFIRQYLGVPELEIPSPTYLVALDYENTLGLMVTHMDLYRISHPSELDEIGLEEALKRGVVLIEWPQNAGQYLPPVDLALSFNITGPATRELTLQIADKSKSAYLRSLEIAEFIQTSWPGKTTRKPFAADASARNYELVENGTETRLLMDAPKGADGPVISQGKAYSQIANLAEEVKPFIAIANLLKSKGMNAPEIYASDMEKGLVLLEHLGKGKITDDQNAPIPQRYLDSAALLANMHSLSWPASLAIDASNSWVIPDFDHSAMMIEVQLLIDWYLQGSEPDINEFKDIWQNYCTTAQEFEKSIVLRDYHSPNIIWNENTDLTKRIGLIDFQDALIGPAAYDLASLAQDARVIISTDLEEDIIQHYVGIRQSQSTDFDVENFRFQYAMMGAQRASKILGIFVRLDKRDGKSQYLEIIPTIRAYLKRNLQHPKLSAYRQWCERVIKL